MDLRSSNRYQSDPLLRSSNRYQAKSHGKLDAIWSGLKSDKRVIIALAVVVVIVLVVVLVAVFTSSDDATTSKSTTPSAKPGPIPPVSAVPPVPGVPGVPGVPSVPSVPSVPRVYDFSKMRNEQKQVWAAQQVKEDTNCTTKAIRSGNAIVGCDKGDHTVPVPSQGTFVWDPTWD